MNLLTEYGSSQVILSDRSFNRFLSTCMLQVPISDENLANYTADLPNIRKELSSNFLKVGTK